MTAMSFAAVPRLCPEVATLEEGIMTVTYRGQG